MTSRLEQAFEKSRPQLGRFAGLSWLASDVVYGFRDALESQAYNVFPYANAAAVFGMTVANLLFIRYGHKDRFVANAQAIAAPSGALVAMSLALSGNFISAAAMTVIATGSAWSGIQARKEYLRQQKEKQLEKHEVIPQPAYEIEVKCAVDDAVVAEEIQPEVMQQFQENKPGIFERFPRLKSNLLVIGGNMVFLFGCLAQQISVPSPAHLLATCVSGMWILGATCMGLSKGEEEAKTKPVAQPQ